MNNQLNYLEEITRESGDLKGELPDAFAAQKAFDEEVYKDGAISRKTKRLIAMAIAVKDGCPGCITYQTRGALEAGASKKEVVEATSVATSMGGTTAQAWAWIVVQVMKESGKW